METTSARPGGSSRLSLSLRTTTVSLASIIRRSTRRERWTAQRHRSLRAGSVDAAAWRPNLWESTSWTVVMIRASGLI